MAEHELHIAEELPGAQELHGAQERADHTLLEERIAELEREVAHLRGREGMWRTERAQLLAALEAAEAEVAQVPALRHEAEVTRDTAYWLAVTQSSWSWRITAPLRAVTRLAGRLRSGRRAS